MEIPKRRNHFFRTAFHSADERHIPGTMRRMEIVFLYSLNVVAIPLSRFVYHPLIFISSYVFSKKHNSLNSIKRVLGSRSRFS